MMDELPPSSPPESGSSNDSPDIGSIQKEEVIEELTVEGSVYEWDYRITVTPEQFARWPLIIRPKPTRDSADEATILQDHQHSVRNVGMVLLMKSDEQIETHDADKPEEGENHQRLQMHHWPLGDPEGLHDPPGLTLPFVVEAVADWIATDLGRKLAGRREMLEHPTSTLGLADMLVATKLWFLTEFGLATVTYKKRSDFGGEVES